MKRQGTLRSSTSGRDAVFAASSADHHSTTTVHRAANSVGCMAGVFQLISSKYRTRRKFLTFGKKQQQKQTTSSASSSPQRSKMLSPARKSRSESPNRLGDGNAKNAGIKEGDSREIRRLSCEVPRSPTIPSEIRRSNSLNSPVQSIVARLMGLEDTPAPQPPVKQDSASEKRRKLLGALEKCDEDLQALKKIIEAVRTTDQPKTPSPPLVSVGRGGGLVAVKKFTDQMSGTVDQEQPSPVSVLEDFCESPPPSSTGGWHSSKRTKSDMCSLGRVMKPQQQQMMKPGENNVEIASFCFHNHSNRLHIPRSPFYPKSGTMSTLSPPRSSGGASMEEAVEEVCRDVEMGKRREIERLGVVVEDFIYRDLIEEMTKSIMGRCHVESSLPYEKCKRKLRF